MSKLNEFRKAEQALREQLALLETLQKDSGLQREIEFEEKLKSLMSEYGIELATLASILNPQQFELPEQTATATRRARQTKIYQNPHTGETISTKGANHRQLKAWKAVHGSDVVEGWLLA